MKIDMSLATVGDLVNLLSCDDVVGIMIFADKVIVGGLLHKSIIDETVGSCLAQVSKELQPVCEKMAKDFDLASLNQDIESYLDEGDAENL